MNILSKHELEPINLKSLTIAIIGCCYGGLSIPDEIGYIKSLEELCVSSEVDLEILPESIENLTNLKKLDLSHSDHLKGLLQSI